MQNKCNSGASLTPYKVQFFVVVFFGMTTTSMVATGFPSGGGGGGGGVLRINLLYSDNRHL